MFFFSFLRSLIDVLYTIGDDYFFSCGITARSREFSRAVGGRTRRMKSAWFDRACCVRRGSRLVFDSVSEDLGTLIYVQGRIGKTMIRNMLLVGRRDKEHMLTSSQRGCRSSMQSRVNHQKKEVLCVERTR
jgi:hypothetical protein